jgi:hypothetical protein
MCVSFEYLVKITYMSTMGDTLRGGGGGGEGPLSALSSYVISMCHSMC